MVVEDRIEVSGGDDRVSSSVAVSASVVSVLSSSVTPSVVQAIESVEVGKLIRVTVGEVVEVFEVVISFGSAEVKNNVEGRFTSVATTLLKVVEEVEVVEVAEVAAVVGMAGFGDVPIVRVTLDTAPVGKVVVAAVVEVMVSSEMVPLEDELVRRVASVTATPSGVVEVVTLEDELMRGVTRTAATPCKVVEVVGAVVLPVGFIDTLVRGWLASKAVEVAGMVGVVNPVKSVELEDELKRRGASVFEWETSELRTFPVGVVPLRIAVMSVTGDVTVVESTTSSLVCSSGSPTIGFTSD